MRYYQNKHLAANWLTKVFDRMGWEWHNIGIPKYNDIVEKLRYLERELVKDKRVRCISSGKLIVLQLLDSGLVIYGLDPDVYDDLPEEI